MTRCHQAHMWPYTVCQDTKAFSYCHQQAYTGHLLQAQILVSHHRWILCLSSFISTPSHAACQIHARLWTSSHSNEHWEGVPVVPSRFNPSKFAPSPSNSPTKASPTPVPFTPAPSQLATHLSSSTLPQQPSQSHDYSQAQPQNSGFADHIRESDMMQTQPQIPANLQLNDYPMHDQLQNLSIERNPTLQHWQNGGRDQALQNLGLEPLPHFEPGFISQSSQQPMSYQQPLSNMSGLHDKPALHGPSGPDQSHSHYQTNGVSHPTGWTHHSALNDTAYQPSTQ